MTTAAYAWQQLTELVALAAGIPVTFDAAGNVYRDLDGGTFDPVRDNGEAAGMAIQRGLTVRAAPGLTVAAFTHAGGELTVAEYDHFNDGDPMTSFRLAVCRAILQQAEVLKNA